MSHLDELWQEYSLNGERLMNGGRLPTLGNPNLGEKSYVGIAAVWLYRKTEHGIEVLFQKRSKKVDRNAEKWDVSAGGHINYQEPLLSAVIREAKEEIGAEITEDMLELSIIHRSTAKNMFFHEFLCNYTEKPDVFHFDDGEVSEVKWVALTDFDDFIAKYCKESLRNNPAATTIVKNLLEINGDNQE